MFLLFISFVTGTTTETRAAVCIKEDDAGFLVCNDNFDSVQCGKISGQYSDSFAGCDKYAESAQGSQPSGKITPANKGLGALKSSVETLTKSGKATKSLEEVIGGYIKTALTLVGMLFMALTFYGGYIWFIARDEEEEAKRAKDIISMALIGLIIVLAAYFVTYFIIYRLTVATGVGL